VRAGSILRGRLRLCSANDFAPHRRVFCREARLFPASSLNFWDSRNAVDAIMQSHCCQKTQLMMVDQLMLDNSREIRLTADNERETFPSAGTRRFGITRL